MKDPVLAVKTIRVPGKNYTLTFRVEGGLNYLRGNRKPYFSITVDQHRTGHPNQCQSGGCMHDEVLKHFPKFADIVALHLSDIDGVPSYAAENGWYRLAGALPDHAGERYHGGNSEMHFPKPEGAPRRGSWDNTDYRKPTPDECLQIFADHARVSLDAACGLRDAVVSWALEGADMRRQMEVAGYAAAGVFKTVDRYDWKHARQEFNAWIERQYPRWKAEADACIAHHGLKVFGDKWEAV